MFLTLLDFAATPMEELKKANKHEAMKARVLAAGIKISRQIFKYWSQNRHLRVQFSLETGRQGKPAPFNALFAGRAVRKAVPGLSLLPR